MLTRSMIVSLALATTAACNPTIEFDVPADGETTIAGGGLVPGLLDVVGLDDFSSIDLNDTREFENNDVRKEQVKAARLTQLRLTITAGDPTFDFLDSLTFSIEAPDVPKAQVASKTVPEGVTTFDCDLAELDLGPYVRASSFALTTEVSGQQPDEDTTIRIDLVFHVVAEVLGPATTG